MNPIEEMIALQDKVYKTGQSLVDMGKQVKEHSLRLGRLYKRLNKAVNIADKAEVKRLMFEINQFSKLTFKI